MERYTINFDIPTRTATVHLSNSNCANEEEKRPEDGEWISSKFLPEESSSVIKDERKYVVGFCGSNKDGCMRRSLFQYERSQRFLIQ